LRDEAGCGNDGGVLEVAIDSSRNAVGEVEGSSNVAVGLGSTETASSITGLSDGWASALSSVECTATLLAIRVLGACLCHESLSIAWGLGGGRRCGSWWGSGWGSTGASSGRSEGDSVKLRDKLGSLLDGRVTEVTIDCSGNAVGEMESCGDVAVGLGGSETTSTIAGLSDGWSSTFSGVERAASLLTVGIDSAWGSDEAISTAERRGLNANREKGDNSADKGSGELHNCGR